ncbi:Cytochrome c [Gemmobacter megaterium]|uniref:Cytochrome c n=1 Tax=Gemmobacter megaterium TaxID=1086013 RepID=A0A1N7KZN2_9RHOB|nr:cytochrome c [Gemmobacter megaterium]GGE04731.1 cytochrome c [Gemmobacter megaterium]SIS66997.1 Cytochrome c [Gemmobacter megaterium]
MAQATHKTAIAAGLTLAAVTLAACLPGLPQRDPEANGARLYADYCAACHGSGGKGDGPAAEGLRPAPADLTQLTAQAGGSFPKVKVMAKVYGYHQGKGGGGGAMPEFGPLLEGPVVLVETAPGVMTPTPEKLVALAEHVERLGRN